MPWMHAHIHTYIHTICMRIYTYAYLHICPPFTQTLHELPPSLSCFVSRSFSLSLKRIWVQYRVCRTAIINHARAVGVRCNATRRHVCVTLGAHCVSYLRAWCEPHTRGCLRFGLRFRLKENAVCVCACTRVANSYQHSSAGAIHVTTLRPILVHRWWCGVVSAVTTTARFKVQGFITLLLRLQQEWYEHGSESSSVPNIWNVVRRPREDS